MHNSAKKKYYSLISTILLSLNSQYIYAKTIKFDELFNQAWEQQTHAKTLDSSKKILDIQNIQIQSISGLFKDRPNLEINSTLGTEKEYEIKTSFEIKSSFHKKLEPRILDSKQNTLSLEQIKHKLDLYKLLKDASWKFILSQQQLQNFNKQLELSEELKKNSFKQYQTGIISYISFKQSELDVLKIQQLQHDAQHELRNNLVNLHTITNNLDISIEDNIEMSLTNINSIDVTNQMLNVENHPLYKYQQSLIQQNILQKSYITNKPKYPITWSIGAGIKQQDKTNYKVMLGIQIPLGKDYSSMQENVEIDKSLIEYKNQLLIIKNQLTTDFKQSTKTMQIIKEQLNILQSAIKTQTNMLEIYAKAMKVGEVDISVYIKNKQELLNLQQQFITHQIQLKQEESNILQILGLVF